VTLSTAERTHVPPPRQVPGEAGVWVFIFGDLTLFAYIFLVYLHYRSSAPQMFRSSRDLLDRNIGLTNTLVLLTSSLLVVVAVRCVRTGRSCLAFQSFAGAMMCGLGFMALKAIEYHAEIDAGHTLTSNRFFTFYYLLTGLHLLHLVLGMGVLACLTSISRRPVLTRGQTILLEGGSCYWHMVDLLWIVIFPLLYLVR
jgi:nitric oxide reductase NorE protein